jgi:hypothetical protein
MRHPADDQLAPPGNDRPDSTGSEVWAVEEMRYAEWRVSSLHWSRASATHQIAERDPTRWRVHPWLVHAGTASPHDPIRLDLRRWSDALQRHIDIPAYVLWPMACLAYEVELTVPTEAMTPEMEAWLWRVKAAVVDVVGAETWHEAVGLMGIAEGRRGSLSAWLDSGEAPRDLHERLRRSSLPKY